MNEAIIVIPARLASSRLPRKVLADIGGKPLLWHVYQRCLQVKQAGKIKEIHIVTDAQEVATAVKRWGGKVWMTPSSCTSGTERIVTLLAQLSGDFIINVQGDQPLIEPQLISQLLEVFENNQSVTDIVTPIYLIKESEKLCDPNLVKVVCRHDGYALYFSRQPIPYVRDISSPAHWLETTTFFGHIGIYGYRREVLIEYPDLPLSPLETVEKLEQLRFLQAGKRILTFITSHIPISVDTPADLEQARLLMAH
jgi:3-deoxy-manno-octulosonate cytidylyltransferase (CMP-KDO synthetase)